MSSCLTTASKPSGIKEPVITRTEIPFSALTELVSPAKISEATVSVTGLFLAAKAVSSLMTAYPSIADFGNGGTLIGAKTSSAQILPYESRRIQFSLSVRGERCFFRDSIVFSSSISKASPGGLHKS